MDTKIDDLTGQPINKDLAYKIKIVAPNKLTLEIDTLFSEQIKNLCAVAKQNGQRWFQWKKDENDRLFKQYPEEKKGEGNNV